jgi:hypothetical protein
MRLNTRTVSERSESLGVPVFEPGSVTALGGHVREREKQIGKLECPANVGRLVDN